MGQIHVPPLQDLALALAQTFGIRDFVETGTFQGSSLEWAAQHFERVYTIEVREDFYAETYARLAYLTKVAFILGDSACELGRVCQRLTSPALFWLDAHAGGGYFGSEDRCPLLQELEVIDACVPQHYLLIDDARGFLAPPPPPKDYRQWPSLDQIMSTLLRRRPWNVVAFDDVIICVPPEARYLVAQYVCRRRPFI